MSASVVRFESASKTYHSGPFWAHSATDALHPTDFEIGPEEMVAMVGELGIREDDVRTAVPRPR